MGFNRNFDINFNLTDKVAVVTGAANGIGNAIASMYLKKGAKVVLADVKEEVEQVARELSKDRAYGVVADVTSRESIESLLVKATDRFGNVDIVVNSAGVAILDDAENISEKAWDTTFAINVKGTFTMCQVFGNYMISTKTEGTIINIASQGGIVALDNHVAYNSSKAAVIMMGKVLAMEWAQFGIRVNTLSPTVIETKLGMDAWAGEVGEKFKQIVPVGRFGYPEEVAGLAVYVASDAASLFTGENFVIDGGYTIQ